MLSITCDGRSVAVRMWRTQIRVTYFHGSILGKPQNHGERGGVGPGQETRALTDAHPAEATGPTWTHLIKITWDLPAKWSRTWKLWDWWTPPASSPRCWASSLRERESRHRRKYTETSCQQAPDSAWGTLWTWSGKDWSTLPSARAPPRCSSVRRCPFHSHLWTISTEVRIRLTVVPEM